MKNIFHLILVQIFCCLSTNAQLVNIETYRIKNDTARFSALASLAFAYSKQNADELLNIGSSGLLKYNISPRNTFLLLGGYRLLKSEDDKIENALLVHFRYNYKFKSWLAAEVFSQYQNDEERALKYRILLGAGPRLQIFTGKKLSSAVGCLYMAEWEEFTLLRLQEAKSYIEHRLSSYFAVNLLLGRNIFELTTVIYYQPKITEFINHRISNNTSLDLNITKHFSSGITINYNYDSFPPRGILKSAFSTTAGMKLKF